MIWRAFEHIAPRGAEFDKEPFEAWFAHVRGDIPHVPACVAETWIHRNWGYSGYHWLPLARLRFEKQRWANAEVLRIGEGLEHPQWSRSWSEELGRVGSAHRQSWVGRFMLEHRTWPAPILVLDNPRRRVTDPSRERLARIHLIEGRVRAAYHHHLATHGLALAEHDVWVAKIARASRSEPMVKPDVRRAGGARSS
jgi:hypothetical protein